MMTPIQFEGMDVVLALKPDELMVEGRIRGINIKTDEHIEQLVHLLNSEKEGHRKPPIQPHESEDIEGEVEKCSKLLMEVESINIQKLVFEKPTLATDSVIRCLHWYNRIGRLLGYADPNRIGELLAYQEKIFELLNRIQRIEVQSSHKNASRQHESYNTSWEDIGEGITNTSSWRSVSGNFSKILDRISEDFIRESFKPVRPGAIAPKNLNDERTSNIVSSNPIGTVKESTISFEESIIKHQQGGIHSTPHLPKPPTLNSESQRANTQVKCVSVNDRSSGAPNLMIQGQEEQRIDEKSPIEPVRIPVSKQRTGCTQLVVNRGTQAQASGRCTAELPLRPAESIETTCQQEPLREVVQQSLRQDSDNRESHQPLDSRQSGLFKKPTFKNLSFDGSPTSDVNDFLFKLEKLSEISGFENRNIRAIILDYVSGDASDFIWECYKDNPEASWNELKLALTSWFGGRNSDIAIRKQLAATEQNITERISTFILKMKQINSKQKNKYLEEELVEIIKENLQPTYRSALISVSHSIKTINQLKILGEECEYLWQTSIDPRIPSRVVTTYPSRVKVPQIHSEATSERMTKQGSFCWNCKDRGHQFKKCKQPRTREFCFGCGKESVRRLNCNICTKRKENC